MPWVNKDDCIGCGICVKECPADAISLIETLAEINMDECIRCGICHEICPQNAVRHDSERISQEIEANVEKVKGYLKHYDNEKDSRKCLKRSMNHFKLMITIAEKTLELLEKMKKEL
ncbi:MAG: 4Fe-4S binding protein [Candidatus Eremiobacteraeota bacterium]|nr:4Fe-4S binding protein [Candidatus Eremiobacteraeota bacterium]